MYGGVWGGLGFGLSFQDRCIGLQGFTIYFSDFRFRAREPGGGGVVGKNAQPCPTKILHPKP